MRQTVSIALVAAAALVPAAAAQAFPLGGPQLAQRVHNGEFRGYAHTSRGFENQIWHFRPDGYIRAVADARVLRRQNTDENLQWQDIGTWRIAAGQVCVSFQGPNRNLDGCYAVTAGPGKEVRLIGRYSWQGTLEPHD